MRLEDLGDPVGRWHPLHSKSPWKPVAAEVPPTGRLAFHYAAPFAHIPCRDVTKLADSGLNLKGPRRADNKSDPNLETLTFGMWSTCDQKYRRTMGSTNGKTLFFRTNWPRDGNHIVTGFYDLGWTLDSWYITAPGKSLGPRVAIDRFLAAREAHFVGEPPGIESVATLLDMDESDLLVRGVVNLDAKRTRQLRSLLLEQRDVTVEYVSEIKRLELCNLSSTGRRYVNWNRTDGFNWVNARTCVRLATRVPPSAEEMTEWNHRGIVPGKWECAECHATLASPRAIKLCSTCPETGGRVLPALTPMQL